MNKLRILFCLVLIVSITLPLSTCEYTAMTKDGNQAEPIISSRYVVPDGGGIEGIVWVVPFLIPAGFTFFMSKRKKTKLSEVGHLVTLVPASVVVWLHGSSGTLAMGGNVSLASIIGLFLIVLCSNLRALNKLL